MLSALPLIPKLILATGQEPPLPIFVIQAASMLQSSILLFAMVLLGAWLSPKVNLGAPVIDAFLNKSWSGVNFKKILVFATIGGVIGGLVLIAFYQFCRPYLPEDFLKNAEEFSPPVYTKLLYGGITEEILIRWGLMSFFVWCTYRCTQSQGSQIKDRNYIVAIFLSALIFGLAHLPAAQMLSTMVTVELLTYIIVGNSIFGFIAGFLYWKQGLESAVLAHMLAHVVMFVGEKFV